MLFKQIKNNAKQAIVSGLDVIDPNVVLEFCSFKQ